ncbi:MAG TPA: IPT/TIG domain-containing protein [Jatrophihabitans sp.]|uniref:IPT/TIG domain-containing protein n=1 Tax=Jatrophihabitans sp. TaxID=1932789 RepID=UPI002E0388D0|nr:IPT/TIG domain-containing protein [Jatrophihabitans sp.]
MADPRFVRRHRRRATAALTSTLLGGAAALAVAPPAGAATILDNVTAAVRYATAAGMSTGIAVLDTRTGRTYSAGNATKRYSGASVVKTLIATRLLLTGRMSGPNASLAWRMITRSDNDAAWDLYPTVGGDALLPWLAAHYRIAGLGARPTMPGTWGSTQLTAIGVARFYAAVVKDRRVWPWLGSAMHHYAARSSEGEPNAWGLAVAAPSVALKNGWATNRDVLHPSNANINSTGVVQGDRFAVALLAEGPPAMYYAKGEAVVSRAAQLLMPGGRLDPPPVVSGLSTHSGNALGHTPVTIAGTGFAHVAEVVFGGVRAPSLTVVSSTRIVVTTPPHAAGPVYVQVVSAQGSSLPDPAGRFTFVSPTNP